MTAPDTKADPSAAASGPSAKVRYLVDDVQVTRGPLSLLLSGPTTSGARATPDELKAAGRNRIHLIVDDLDAEIERLKSAGQSFRSELVSGPGGRQILLTDPAGNLIELFQPG
jgi:predicted enzyme related to lactoylglutathione lyase